MAALAAPRAFATPSRVASRSAAPSRRTRSTRARAKAENVSPDDPKFLGRKGTRRDEITDEDADTTVARTAVKLDGAFFGLEVSYHLDELTPTSTRVTQYSKARFKHVFKLMGLFFGKKMQREGERVQAENFARMKEMIEAEARAAEASSGD